MSKNQFSEKDMLLDSIMTERYISSAYDSGILDSANEEVVKALKHIQDEEQDHAKLFMEIMHNHGWSDIQGAHINQTAMGQINKQLAFQLENRLNQMEGQ